MVADARDARCCWALPVCACVGPCAAGKLAAPPTARAARADFARLRGCAALLFHCQVMTRYISSADDFKLIMLLLRDNSKTIQFEAFHVFKIFVANPNRPKPIVDILVRNREKLVAFLQRFQVRPLALSANPSPRQIARILHVSARHPVRVRTPCLPGLRGGA